MPTNRKTLRYQTALAVLAALSAFPAVAQDAAKPTGDPTIDTMLVTGAEVPISDSIMPTVRPYSAAFGVDQNIQDVPRNVTIISREQLDAISIQDVRDFSKLTSSSYTTSNFGAPANPSLRGQYADVFVNGMKKSLTNNGNGMPVNFNSVESVDIFKGPPTVIYGVSNGYTGGFINFVTKKPYFGKFQGSASFTLGEYDQNRWNLDIGGPIIADKLAYRVSYSGEESGSYYENGDKHTQAIYGAITWTPSSNYTLDLNAEMFFADYVENFGINRVTQDLVDNNKYITGFVGDQNGDGKIDNRDVNGGFNSVILGKTITIDRSTRLLAPGDGSYGRSFNLQAIQTFNIADNFTIVNNTLYQWVKRQTKSSYYYSEIIDPAQSIENRTEFRLDFDTPYGSAKPAPAPMGKDSGMSKDAKTVAVVEEKIPSLKTQINFGLDIRYQEVTAFNDFNNEPANAWDLSRPRSEVNYVNYSQGGSVPVPGYSGRYATPGIDSTNGGDTNRSRQLLVSPFLQTDFKFTDQLSLLLGARLDVLYVETIDPLFKKNYVERFQGLTNEQRGFDGEDSTVVGIPNFNISPSYKPFPWLTTYFTYNYSQSTASANGGGFPAVGSNIDVQGQLRRESELFEFGVKASLLNDTLFIGSALFHQTRVVQTLGSGSNALDVDGFEIEANYQPNKNFYATVGYTYLDAQLKDQVPFSVQQYTIDDPNAASFFPGSVVTDTFGGVGPAYGKGDYEQPGLPDHLFNGLVSYSFDTSIGKFGIILGGVVTGQYNYDYLGKVVIPWQYSIDATAFYKNKYFEAKIACLNATDEENWSPANAVYALDSITPDLPRRFEGTITIKF